MMLKWRRDEAAALTDAAAASALLPSPSSEQRMVRRANWENPCCDGERDWRDDGNVAREKTKRKQHILKRSTDDQKKFLESTVTGGMGEM